MINFILEVIIMLSILFISSFIAIIITYIICEVPKIIYDKIKLKKYNGSDKE